MGARGSATVEMAFLLPVFLLLVFGVFEFAHAWLVLNTLNHASREAVRLAATKENLNANDSDVIAKAQGVAQAAGVTGTTVSNSSPSGSPPEVSVTTSLNYSYMTGITLLGFSFSGTIPMTAAATMRYER